MPDHERLKLFNKLCKKCSRNRVVPKSMNIPDCSEGSVEVECGGFANILQSTYNQRRVAVKVMRMYITSDLDVILSVSLQPVPSHVSDKWIIAILPRGCCLETPPASQHLAAPWSDSE